MSITIEPSSLLESIGTKEIVLMPLSKYKELVARSEEAAKREGFQEIQIFKNMLTDIPVVEAIIANRLRKGFSIWTVTDQPSEEEVTAIYWKEWELMEHFPETDFDFHVVEREGKPLDELVTLNDVDLFLPLGGSSHAG